MWLSKNGDSISKFMGTGINVGSVDSKMETESQSLGSSSHSISSSVSLKWKFANSSMGWYWSSSRLCGEMNLGQSLQDTMILGFHQYG